MWTCRLIDLEVVYGSRAQDVAGVIEETALAFEALATSPEAPLTDSETFVLTAESDLGLTDAYFDFDVDAEGWTRSSHGLRSM